MKYSLLKTSKKIFVVLTLTILADEAFGEETSSTLKARSSMFLTLDMGAMTLVNHPDLGQPSPEISIGGKWYLTPKFDLQFDSNFAIPVYSKGSAAIGMTLGGHYHFFQKDDYSIFAGIHSGYEMIRIKGLPNSDYLDRATQGFNTKIDIGAELLRSENIALVVKAHAKAVWNKVEAMDQIPVETGLSIGIAFSAPRGD